MLQATTAIQAEIVDNAIHVYEFSPKMFENTTAIRTFRYFQWYGLT